jgi:hypothetical protein
MAPVEKRSMVNGRNNIVGRAIFKDIVFGKYDFLGIVFLIKRDRTIYRGFATAVYSRVAAISQRAGIYDSLGSVRAVGSSGD